MLSTDELTTLQQFCHGDLADEPAGVISCLTTLTPEDKKQFWQWLKAHDSLLIVRLIRAKQRLEANPAKPEPWYVERLKQARA